MSEEDDRIRRGIGHIFSPDWAHNLGQRIGQAIHDHTSDSFRERLQGAARRYVDTVDPKAAQQRQDEEIAANKQKIEIYKNAQQAPRDLGDVDSDEYVEQVRRAQANAKKQ